LILRGKNHCLKKFKKYDSLCEKMKKISFW
jgi:hypothetical protein